MKNTFGQSVSVTLFGESHGAQIGAVIDGLAPGIPVDEDYIGLAARSPQTAGQDLDGAPRDGQVLHMQRSKGRLYDGNSDLHNHSERGYAQRRLRKDAARGASRTRRYDRVFQISRL